MHIKTQREVTCSCRLRMLSVCLGWVYSTLNREPKISHSANNFGFWENKNLHNSLLLKVCPKELEKYRLYFFFNCFCVMTRKLYFLVLKIQLHKLLKEIGMVATMSWYTQNRHWNYLFSITKCHNRKFWYVGGGTSVLSTTGNLKIQIIQQFLFLAGIC